MILEIYEKETLNRVDIIRKWTYVNYVEQLNDSGSFTIKVSSSDTCLKYLNIGNFILFEEDILGVIKGREKERDNESFFIITGYLINLFLDYRCFIKTQTFSGKLSEIVKSMVDKNFISPDNENRKFMQIKFSENENSFPESKNTYSIQCTGKKVSYGIQDVLLNENWGYKLSPVIVAAPNEDESNLQYFELSLIKPIDRTFENLDGNNPIVFSYKNGNVKNISYSEDGSSFSNIMVVAGEGEGEQRKVIEIGDDSLSGMDRIEEYVDARDLQKQKDDGTELTNDEYEKLLIQRGKQKQQEHIIFTTINGSIIDNNMFKYGIDYKLGDFVTVVENFQIQGGYNGIISDVQVTGVSKYYTKNSIITDILFGYEKSTVRQLLRKEGSI